MGKEMRQMKRSGVDVSSTSDLWDIQETFHRMLEILSLRFGREEGLIAAMVSKLFNSG